MDITIVETLADDEGNVEVSRRQEQQQRVSGDSDFVQMPSTIRNTLDEIKNPQSQGAYKPTQKKPWVYHGTRRRLFNSNTYATFSLRLVNLQNLRTKSTESVGDYMVSVFFKGRLYGAYLSGAVDLESLTALTRHKKRLPAYLHSPKVTLEHEIKLHLRFKDMVDNPVVLALTLAGDSPPGDLTLTEPFAYTCLNVINLVRKGKEKNLLRPWYCVQKKTPPGILLGFPFIDVEVTGFGGLPNPEQLKQGNIMTTVVESMYRLPPEIQAMTNQPNNEMEVFVTLPHSESENVFHFPAGMLEKLIPPIVAEIFDKTQTNEHGEGGNNIPESQIEVQPTGIMNQSNGIPVFLEQKHGAHRHWASVQSYYPEAPRGASVVTGKKRIIKLAHDKYCLAGDVGETGDTSWKGYLNSSDTRLVWNSLHRHYMGLESYKQMLERLAKQVIWPLEIAVTIRREKEGPSKKVTSNSSLLKKERSSLKKDGSVVKKDPASQIEAPRADSLHQEVNEEPQFELNVIYHGVAFVDMTKLLHPGAKRAHYACRLYPFEEAVFMASTCAIKSAFLSSLTNSNIDYVIDDSKKAVIETSAKSDTVKSPPGNTSDKKQRKSDAAKKDIPIKTFPSAEEAEKVEKKTKKQQPGKKQSVYQMGQVGQETLKISSLDDSANFPFIVFQIRMNRALVPPIARDKKGVHKCASDYLPMRRFPRKKLMNSTLAQKKYRHSVLEAAAELSHQFHDEYLDYIVKEGVSRAYLDPRSPASSFENIKKGFLFYLNASGRYLVLREHLRHAVSNIIQQKCTNLQPKGFKSRREFQNFLHDMYLYLVDEMHETLNTTALQEIDPLANRAEPKGSKDKDLTGQGKDKKICKKSQHSKKGWIAVENLLMFAQEAFAQCDYENSHRLHVERVARSGESSECWADFAIMWLSRGDDRLAEIAVRESLLKNEKNLKALIISGVIAARHNDSRAITCLGAALRLRPISPEILVLIGAAHACLGNDVASEYFFKKARFVHHLLTGKDTSTISDEFASVSAKWDLTEAGNSLDKAQPGRPMPSHEHRGSIFSIHGQEVQIERDVEISPSVAGDDDKQKKKRKNSQGNQKHKGINETDDGITKGFEGRKNFQPFAQRPQYDFPVEELVIKNRKAIKFAKLPSMGPSIVQVWNVTKFTRRFKSKSKRPRAEALLAERSQAETNPKTDSKKIAQNSNENDPKIGKGLGNESIGGEENPEELGEYDLNPELIDDMLLSEDGNPVTPSSRQRQKKEKEHKTISRRVGSEYIWTAHVLLKLRLFDFLDGILARELTFNEKREIPFLYLRAMSLHFRQRDLEALEFIKEALQLQPSNPIIWAIRGHCYYNLHLTDPAIQSYERALKLPHGHENMQLVYLRYGSLCLEKGNVKLAKKVFLKGVHAFPSPYMWMATGNICYHLKEYSQSETAFAEANRLDNTNPIIWAHLSLVSLAKGHKTLAEQSYKWAIRFGLKKCRLMDEIKDLHRKKGFGNPGFPRIPHCIPHEYYLKRLGRDRPFDEYKDALKFPKPKQKKNKHGNTHREKELIKKLNLRAQEKIDQANSKELENQMPPDESQPQTLTIEGEPVKLDKPATPKTSLKAISTHEKQGKKGKPDGKTRTAPTSANAKGADLTRRKSSQK